VPIIPSQSDSPNTSNNNNHGPSTLELLLAKAQHFLSNKNADGAFATLAQAYGIDPTSSKISAMFEACLGLKVELAEANYYEWKEDHLDSSQNNKSDDSDSSAHAMHGFVSEKELNDLFQDRMGLSSLFIDREHYEGAGMQLRKAIEEAMFWLNYSLQSSHEEGDGLPDTDGSHGTSSADFSSTRFKHWQPLIDRAQYLLYRTNAACCQWGPYFEDGDRLRQSLLHDALSSPSGGQQVVRLLHPFDALKFPCISLELASNIASSYASRALESVGVKSLEDAASLKATNQALPRRNAVTADGQEPKQLQRKIRIGYISPDFTSRHPLAFLMQHVFRCHDKSNFVVNIYSLTSSTSSDDGPEVQAIRESSDQFTYLSPSSMSHMEMYQRMMQDELDILVDLCGYAGTSVVSEVMASRCRLRQDQNDDGSSTTPIQRRFPFHVSYMGFPGSTGSSTVWDYSVFDPIVVPPEEKYGIRRHYEEALVYMPHCYFVNSHKSVVGGTGDAIMVDSKDERRSLRSNYGIHPSAFVYCCHSRPDKVDPSTFRSWMRALSRVRLEGAPKHQNRDATIAEDDDANGTVAPVLWLLRSGDEMEQNIRQLAREEFGQDMEDCLVFADVAERTEHLRRLGIADVFLDTPAYNAHTLGCDALYMGVPMISLLRKLEQNDHVAADSKLNLESADVNSDFNDLNFGREMRSIATDKLASRVGASLLEAVGLDDLIYPDMAQYEDAMVRCALDKEWFNTVCQRLISLKDASPLFDTERWVHNLEAAFRKMVDLDLDGGNHPDIFVTDNS